MSETWHVCLECWQKLTPDQKLTQAREWQKSRYEREALVALTEFLRTAIDSTELSALLRPRPNEDN